MRLLSIILISLVVLSNKTHAENTNTGNTISNDKNIWFEISGGSSGDFICTSVNLKFGDEVSNWALELGHYSDFTN